MFIHFEYCWMIEDFVPTKLLNLIILCWKQIEFFFQSNISLFNKKTIVEKLWTIVYLLRNIVEYHLNIVGYMTSCLKVNFKVTYIVETKLFIGKKEMEKGV